MYRVPVVRVRPHAPAVVRRARGAAVGCLLGVIAAHGFAAGVVADGSTATTVTTAAGGHITVNVAAAVGGVSTNNYREFNVPRAGVDLDNSTARARTILNQVTGTNPSLLEGPLSVLGPRANVVIANPNGISVDGMVVRNVGNLALTTGQVSFNDFTANGQLQRNLVLSTNQGAIDIGAGGLSGTLLNLELVAKRLRVAGKVENTFDSPNSRIRAVLGDSHAEIDTSVSPNDNLTPWIAYSAGNGAATPAMALDITAAGSLIGGRVELIVTDQGAGVRHAGAAFATAGDFVIQGNGNLELASGKIQAARDVVLVANNIALHDAAITASGGSIRLRADGAWTQQDADVLAAADVELHAASASLTSITRQSTIVANGGAVLIEVDGDLKNLGGLIQGQRRIADAEASAGAVTVRAGASLLNESTPQYLGILFGAGDDVVVRAGGDVVNRHARILSNAALDIAATGDLINEIGKQAGTGGDPVVAATSARRWLVLSKRRSTFDVDYGTVDRPGQSAYLLSETGTTLSGRNVLNIGGEIYANDGAITIRAADTFRTEGVTTGSAHFTRTCMIVCRTSSSSDTSVVGGLLSAAGNIDINAGRAAINVGGRVLAVGDLNVNAPVTYATGVAGYTAIARDRGFKAFFGDTWARLYAMDIGGSWMATGRTRIGGDAVVTGGSFDGDVSIAGNTLVVRPRQIEPVSVESHLGMTSWLWR
ncbi:filamentous hemagglutinin N-terminal domain-containing protein [Cupriavidus plantarum]|uniref:filamentous hemagglutinin N-terminal domain-containing protein n=2 Tax=Cupriavidus plantarum TaxID=942865 RepID=UPI00339D9AA5